MSDTLYRLGKLLRASINKPWNSLRPWAHPVEYAGALRYLWRYGAASYSRQELAAMRIRAETQGSPRRADTAPPA